MGQYSPEETLVFLALACAAIALAALLARRILSRKPPATDDAPTAGVAAQPRAATETAASKAQEPANAVPVPPARVAVPQPAPHLSSQLSYTAIAVAEAARAAPRQADPAPAVAIDYSGEATDVPPGASYTAIAVAAAARTR